MSRAMESRLKATEIEGEISEAETAPLILRPAGAAPAHSRNGKMHSGNEKCRRGPRAARLPLPPFPVAQLPAQCRKGIVDHLTDDLTPVLLHKGRGRRHSE